MDPTIHALQRQIDKLQAELRALRAQLGRLPARPGIIGPPSSLKRVVSTEPLAAGGEANAYRTIWNGTIWESVEHIPENVITVHDYRIGGAAVAAGREMIIGEIDGIEVMISTRC